MTCFLSLLQEKYAAAPLSPPAAGDADADENYNSDLDPECTAQSAVMATLVKKITAMKAAGRGGAGYVYVMGEAAASAGAVRVRVAASRCPRKRVQQAQRFNPDARLLASCAVSQRVAALTDVHSALTAFRAPGVEQPDWFYGRLDAIVGLVETAAASFPVTALDDATVDHSES